MNLEQAEKELLPCPFCGGKAIIKRGEIFDGLYFKAKCSHCHSSTNMITVGQNCFYGTTTTEQEAMQKAARLWNSTYSRENTAV